MLEVPRYFCLVFILNPVLDDLLFVLAAPGAPGAPEVVKSGKNYVDLTWQKPVKDGGNKIKGETAGCGVVIIPQPMNLCIEAVIVLIVKTWK